MTVAMVLKEAKETRLVHWAARIARARRSGLVLFWVRTSRGKSKRTSSRDDLQVPEELQSICDELDLSDFHLFRETIVEDESEETTETEPQLPVEVISVCSGRVHLDLEQEVNELGVKCLIIPREPQLRSGSRDAQLHDHLLGHVPCEIVMLTPGTQESGKCRRIVTPVGEGPHSVSCLRMANDVADVSAAKLVALHVEPNFDITAKQAAESILSKTVDQALGNNQERVKKHVVLNNDVLAGIDETLDDATDLIILGMKRTGLVKRFSSQGIAEKLVNSNPGPAIAVLQSALPLSSQVGRRLDELLRCNVPQLPRDERVSLVERIQSSSRWDFDFVMLICMSALIAAGGLIQDSAAVVIGAMLVAPLMTPLLGSGLAITQGNLVLLRTSLLTVGRGFLLAFLISFLLAAVFGAGRVTHQMALRGSPQVLDILIAMVGGIAAAYASGRPNLLSALPGVAIAASLVPPISTAGIALWLWDPGLVLRAALLFFTNIVAIILGTWLAFRAVGIRSTHQHGEFDRWTLGAAGTLVLLVLLLGYYDSKIGHGATINILQTRLNNLAAQDQWTCKAVDQDWIDGKRIIRVHLESPKIMPRNRLNRIRAAINDSYESPPTVMLTTTTTNLD